MKINKNSLLLCTFALGALAASTAQATVTMGWSAEKPGVVNTTMHQCTLVETFDTESPSNTIGVYSKAYISPGDQYGGAGGSMYLDLDSTGIDVVRLDLNQTESYFGLWWSAAHPGNKISFFLGENKIKTFETSDIFPLTDPDYYGNPEDNGANDGEQYAFINFYGAEFDKIVFKQRGGGGFESDNHTVARPCGVPDGGSVLSVFSLAMIALGWGRRKLAA